jgi:hypothetical protein
MEEDSIMILGLSTSTFTMLHVIISLVAIAAGFVMLGSMVRTVWSPRWNGLFLITTIATSATGFLFHSKSFGPPHVIGIISLVVLAISVYSLYARRLVGVWQRIYTISAAFAFYLNVFVGVVQAFQKIPSLQVLAPTQSEGPFIAAQAVVLLLIIGLTYLAVRRLSSVADAASAGVPA